MKWKLIVALFVLVGCSHYTIKFVDVTNKKPKEIVAQKVARSKDSQITVHYMTDTSHTAIRLTNIDTSNDGYIIADTNSYLRIGPHAEAYNEARKRIQKGKLKAERYISPGEKSFYEQLHLYSYHSDSIMSNGKILIKDSQIDVGHDLKYEPTPPSWVLLVVLLSTLGVGFIFILIYWIFYSFFQAWDNAWENACYVATMVYESNTAPEVMTLRKFRDRYLKTTFLGRGFITMYYKNSPRFVQKHQNSPRTKKVIKVGLNIFVKFLDKVMK